MEVPWGGLPPGPWGRHDPRPPAWCWPRLQSAWLATLQNRCPLENRMRTGTLVRVSAPFVRQASQPRANPDRGPGPPGSTGSARGCWEPAGEGGGAYAALCRRLGQPRVLAAVTVANLAVALNGMAQARVADGPLLQAISGGPALG